MPTDNKPLPMTVLEVHKLHLLACEKCKQAQNRQYDYIGFRRRGGGFQLIASRTDLNGRSSARMGLPLSDWATNVLYRLREEGFISADVALDDYFELRDWMIELGLRWRT